MPTKRSIQNFCLAIVPLLLLGTITIARMYAANKFVLCAEGPDRCAAMPANFTSILLIEMPKSSGEMVAEQTELKWQQKSTAAAAEQKSKGEAAERAEQKYSGRLNWLFMTFLCVVACLGAIVLASVWICKPVRVPAKSNSGEKRKGLSMRWDRLAISLAGMFVSWYWLYGRPQQHMPVLSVIIPSTLDTDVHGIQPIIQAVNAFGFAAAALVSIAISIIIWDVLQNVDSTGATKAEAEGKVVATAGSADAKKTADEPAIPESTAKVLNTIRQGMRRLQSLLYASTIMLVVGVLLERSLFQWAMAFVVHEEHTLKAAQNFFATLLTVDGAFYTLALGAVYLPSAFILKRRGEQSEDLPADQAAKEKELQSLGLNFSFTESLPKLLAILAPLLTGPIGELFGRLGK